MVIVDVLPKLNVVCVVVVNADRGVVVEEVQIDLAKSSVRSIRFDGHPKLSHSSGIGHFVNSVLCLVSLKAAQTLGTPRFDVSWKEAMSLAKQVGQPFEFHVAMADVEEGMALSEMGQLSSELCITLGTTADSVLVGGHSHWIADEPLALLT